ncbi:hypothetical protein EYF80_039617 [Liparis tanakae]|uniref:Uncharacterized protein n=1 Tax=Liparis tanakae TaxID=230148 RepID=A0A4Z2GBA3_9TELE|nr:hypothetical protein EYF80_039617 [Liparis tanakae]
MDVILQLLQGDQLHVRQHAALLVEAPHDAGHQTAHDERKKHRCNVPMGASKMATFSMVFALVPEALVNVQQSSRDGKSCSAQADETFATLRRVSRMQGNSCRTPAVLKLYGY